MTLDIIPKVVDFLNGVGDYAELSQVEGLGSPAQPAVWGSQYKSMNVVMELIERVLADPEGQNQLVRKDFDEGVYTMEGFIQTQVDGYVGAFQSAVKLNVFEKSAYDLNERVKQIMNRLATSTSVPFATIADIQTFPNPKTGSGRPAYQADITYHVTIPAIADLSGELEPAWVLVYDFGYSGRGQRYINSVGETHDYNFVCLVITAPNENGQYPVRDAVINRMLGFQPDQNFGMTTLVTVNPVEPDGNSNFVLWRVELRTFRLNYGE